MQQDLCNERPQRERRFRVQYDMVRPGRISIDAGIVLNLPVIYLHVWRWEVSIGWHLEPMPMEATAPKKE